jgi:hypothetical protein
VIRLSYDDWRNSLSEHERRRLDLEFEKLLGLFQMQETTSIRWWHKVGERINKVFSIGERHPSIEVLANELEPGRETDQKSLNTNLFLYRNFAQRFNREEVSDLAKSVKQQDLSVSHVRCLVNVDKKNNSKSWEDFRDESVAQGWSANQLKREIQEDKSELTRTGRSKGPRTKSSTAVAVQQINSLAQEWLACDGQYFQKNSAPLKRIPKRASKRLQNQIEKARDQVREVASIINAEKESLEAIVNSWTKPASCHSRRKSAKTSARGK